MREPASQSNNKTSCWPFCVVVLLCVQGVSKVSAATLNQVRVSAYNHVELYGDFGSDCTTCEILVYYAGGLTYAYRPESWQKTKLEFQLLDLGRSLEVAVRIGTSVGVTAPQSAVINPKYLPEKLELKAETKADDNFLFQRRYTDPFGGKGKDRFDVSTSAPTCNRQGALFHDMALFLTKKRFGDARITGRPPTGCADCSPIEVEWYHEPTGFINYQLAVQYRIVSGVCPDRIR